MSAFPIMLRGDRVRALIVGAGAVATRKALALLDAGATVAVVAPVVSDELRARAERCERLTIRQREFNAADVADASIVVAATSSRDVNAAVALAAVAANRLVSVADMPEEGTFTGAALHRTGDLVIAVATSGVPSAAVRIRDALAERFDHRYAHALDALRALRTRLLADPLTRDRWSAASAELTGTDFVAAVENGTLAERVRSWA